MRGRGNNGIAERFCTLAREAKACGPGLLVDDALHVPIGTGITTPRDLFSGGHAGLITNTGTALLLYRPFKQPTQYADLGIGFRAWGFTANLTLKSGTLPGGSANQSASWVDPLIGGRYHIDLPSRFLPSGFGLMGYGDVGGFGVGAHRDWQLMARSTTRRPPGSTSIWAIAVSTLTIRRLCRPIGLTASRRSWWRSIALAATAITGTWAISPPAHHRHRATLLSRSGLDWHRPDSADTSGSADGNRTTSGFKVSRRHAIDFSQPECVSVQRSPRPRETVLRSQTCSSSSLLQKTKRNPAQNSLVRWA